MGGSAEATIFQWAVGIAGFGLLFILNTIRNDIKSLKVANEASGAKLESEVEKAMMKSNSYCDNQILHARRAYDDSAAGKLALIAEVRGVAEEGKRLAVTSLDRLNQHERHVAENYVSVKRFEGFETALFKKLDSIESKLDRKVDKGGGLQ